METKQKENGLELLKRYWFVGLVCIGLVVFCIKYAYDYTNNKPIEIETKQENDQYVVYDIDGENYFVDELYADLYTDGGVSREYNKFSEMVLNAAYKSTSEMETLAANLANYYVQQYGEDQINASLISMGYTHGISDLTKYYLTYYKNLEMLREYYTEHYDDKVVDAIKDMNLKKVSHILIKVADVEETETDGTITHKANPTDEEKAKLDKVLEELKTKSFEEVAKEYSEDGSASQGGYLGLYTDDSAASTFVSEFADTVRNTANGQTSAVITSEFGYHIIKNDAPTKEEILADDNTINSISNAYSQDYTKILMAKAEEVGYKIYDEKLEKQIKEETETDTEGGEE